MLREDDPYIFGDTPHKEAKSVDVFMQLVKEFTPPGGLIVDPFAGSGTTGLAAILEGRQFVGIEEKNENILTSTERLEGAAHARDEEEWIEREWGGHLPTADPGPEEES